MTDIEKLVAELEADEYRPIEPDELDALIADWRRLKEENENLRDDVDGWGHLESEAMRAQCEAIAWKHVNNDGYIADVAHEITALKVKP